MFSKIKNYITENTGILIRIDDIAENMNWDLMRRSEKLFDKYDIKPVLGIIPINKDEELKKKLNHLNRENFIKESVFKYLSIRINPKNKKINFFSKFKFKIDYYCLMFNHHCINFIKRQS